LWLTERVESKNMDEGNNDYIQILVVCTLSKRCRWSLRHRVWMRDMFLLTAELAMRLQSTTETKRLIGRQWL
jgi:hypothetical protein